EILWYRSNSSGLALEFIPSRLAALRYEYCLSVERIRSQEALNLLPSIILPFYDGSFRVELRIIHKNGEEYRRQWLFKDEEGYTRLTASGSLIFFNDEKPLNTESRPATSLDEEADKEEEKFSGFIEIRDNEGLLVREIRFEDDFSEWEFRYNYRGGILLSAETLFKKPPSSSPAAENEEMGLEEEKTEASPPEPAAEGEWRSSSSEPAAGGEGHISLPSENREDISPLTPAGPPVFLPVSTDYFRYSRSGSLRAIDRVIHEEGSDLLRVTFPNLGPVISKGEELVTHGVSYSSSFLSDVSISEGAMVSYTLDDKGRILSEVWKNEDDEILGEFRNNWKDDRLGSVVWKSEGEERLVEYEYDSEGNRIAERNLRNGILERMVTSKDERDTEEIYMDGKLILRAYWEKGLKISEERIFPSAGGTP
ncbi:MAG: hypothetical protein FWH35_06615, partial [Treponema sp.]|nr:hypothetical protein [Treponema sp.]